MNKQKTKSSPSKRVVKTKVAERKSITKASVKKHQKATIGAKTKKKVSTFKKADTKIASEFAIGVVLLIALLVGLLFWYKNSKEEEIYQLSAAWENESSENKTQAIREENEKESSKETCTPHYYEGLTKIEGWFLSQDESGIMVAVKESELSKLPNTNSEQLSKQDEYYSFKLIDSTTKIASKIKASSQEKPATFTIKGYAEICQQPPLLSLQAASSAFKKRT